MKSWLLALLAILLLPALGPCQPLALAQQPATNWIGFVASCPADLGAGYCDALAQAAIGSAHGFDGLHRAGIHELPPPVGWPAQAMCMSASAGVLRLLLAQDGMGAHNFPPGGYQRVLCAPAADLQRLGYPVLGWDYGFCRQHPYDEACQQVWPWMQAWDEGLIP